MQPGRLEGRRERLARRLAHLARPGRPTAAWPARSSTSNVRHSHHHHRLAGSHVMVNVMLMREGDITNKAYWDSGIDSCIERAR